MVNFNAKFSGNLSVTQRQYIQEALQEFGSYLNDNVTVNLAFANTNLLDSNTKAATISEFVGGLDPSKLDLSGATPWMKSGANANVVTFAEFNSALLADRKSSTDDLFTSNISSQIYGSILHPASHLQDYAVKGVQMTAANAKAVGLGNKVTTNLDAIIVFNRQDSLTRQEFKELVKHEVGHALGFTSAVDQISNVGAYYSVIDTSENIFTAPFVSPHQQEELYRINPLDFGRYVPHVKDKYNAISSLSQTAAGAPVHALTVTNVGGVPQQGYFSVDGGKTKVSDFAYGSFYNRYKEYNHYLNADQHYFQTSHWDNDIDDGGLLTSDFNNFKIHGDFTQDDLKAFDAIGWDINYAKTANTVVTVSTWTDDTIKDVSGALLAYRRLVAANTRNYYSLASTGEATFNTVTFADNFIQQLQFAQSVNNSSVIRIEAENANSLSNYWTEAIGDASGGKALSLFGGQLQEAGSAAFVFNGAAGKYNIDLGVFDENDGVSAFTIKVNNNAVGQTVRVDQNLGSSNANFHTAAKKNIAANLSLNTGDAVTVFAVEQGDEHARFDYIQFERAGTTTTPTTPITTTPSVIQVQAENFASYVDFGGSPTVEDSGNGGKNVGSIEKNEKLTYGVNVPTAGLYDVSLRVAADSSITKSLSLVADGKTYTSATFVNTNGWQTYKDVLISGVTIGAGAKNLTFNMNEGQFNFDSFKLIPTGTTTTTPVVDNLAPATPRRIQAEDYFTSYDTSAVNEGGAYRTGAVDIEAGGTGYNVGYIARNEYLTYGSGVTAGKHNVFLRVASADSSSKTINLTVGGKTYTSPVLGHTGGWQNYQDLLVSNVDFATGNEQMRIDFTHSGLNFDYIEIA